MSKIVISGYYGFGNAGDEAMLAAILEAILKVIPEAKITVISGNPASTKAKYGVDAVPRLSSFKLLKAIAECDLFISGGGSLLQDVTSKRSLYYYLAIISMAKLLNKPVMLYAQGIGPLQSAKARHYVGKVLNKVDLITVRDEHSKTELELMGVDKTPIEVTADAVLSMHPVDLTIGKRLLEDFNLQGTKPLVGVSVRTWKDHTQYRKILAEALDKVIENLNANVFFIPMQYPDDANEAKCIAALMSKKSIILDKAYNTTELLSLSGLTDVMLGIRLHSLIFTALMERPIIGISYDPKIDNFMKMMGKNTIGDLNNLSVDLVYNEIKSTLDGKTDEEKSIRLIRKLRNDSLKNAYSAFKLLQSKEKR